MINQYVNVRLESMEENLDSESLTTAICTSLNGVMHSWMNEASQKNKSTVDEILAIADSTEFSFAGKKRILESKKQVINETNQVLANQQVTIKNVKNNVINAINIGCSSKLEYSNIVTQMTQYHSTKNQIQNKKLKSILLVFNMQKTNQKTNPQGVVQLICFS